MPLCILLLVLACAGLAMAAIASLSRAKRAETRACSAESKVLRLRVRIGHLERAASARESRLAAALQDLDVAERAFDDLHAASPDSTTASPQPN